MLASALSARPVGSARGVERRAPCRPGSRWSRAAPAAPRSSRQCPRVGTAAPSSARRWCCRGRAPRHWSGRRRLNRSASVPRASRTMRSLVAVVAVPPRWVAQAGRADNRSRACTPRCCAGSACSRRRRACRAGRAEMFSSRTASRPVREQRLLKGAGSTQARATMRAPCQAPRPASEGALPLDHAPPSTRPCRAARA